MTTATINSTDTSIAADAPYPNHAYACYVIFVLFVVTVLSQLDRQLPTLLVEPIKREFAISDTAFSFLQGYAFAIVYTFAGLPLGRLVDQRSRRLLIFCGLVFWSLMTVYAGFAQSYSGLFVARMGVGIGEAVLAPAAYSIIADYFAPAKRGRALGIYYISIAIGSGASLLLGGLLLDMIPEEGMSLPFFGHLVAWRWVFIFAGVPGLLLSGLMFTIREPVRREIGQRLNVPVAELLAFLRREKATFSRLLVYPSILAIIGYGSLAWAPTVFIRRFDMDISHSGILLGGLIALAGVLGGLISGHLSDHWRSRGLPAARFRVALLGQLLLLPCVSSWSLMPNPQVALVVLFFAILGLSIAQTAAPAAIQEVTPNPMRGQIIAIYLLLGGLLGIGLGPTLVAVVSDQVFKGEALHLAVSATAFPVSLLGLWLCWSGQSRYARSRERLWGTN